MRRSAVLVLLVLALMLAFPPVAGAAPGPPPPVASARPPAVPPSLSIAEPPTSARNATSVAGGSPVTVIAAAPSPAPSHRSGQQSRTSQHPPPSTIYYWYFDETGLPSGTSWSMWWNQPSTSNCYSGAHDTSTSTSIAFVSTLNENSAWCVGAVPGYTPSPASGQNYPGTVDITFTKTTYPVDFTETGLPTGSSWSVTLNGTKQASTTTTNDFAMPNGTYSWSESATGYTGSPPSGSITVSAASVSQSIAYTLEEWAVTFTESGLPSGTSWSVTFNGVKGTSTTTTLPPFYEPNSTYQYTVGSVSGYESSPSSGAVTVQGAPVTQSITFAPYPAVTASGSPNPADTGISVTFSAVLTGGTSPYTYSWTIAGTVESTAASFAYTFTSTGSYTINLTVTDADSNHAYSQFSETVDSPPSASASSNVSVADVGYPIQFTASASGGTGGYTYAWTLNGVSESTAASFSHAFASSGSYTMDVRVTDSAGSATSASVAVTINPNPAASASASANPVDVGVAVTFNANGQYGTGTLSYAWTINGASEGSGASIAYTFNAAGGYTVSVTVTDGEAHSATSSLTETVNANPVASVSSSQNPTDVGNTITFTSSVSGGTGTYTYVWQVDGSTVGGATASTYSQAFSSSGTHTIQVTITDADGHTSSSSLDETVNGAVSVSLSSSQNPTDYGDTVTYTATASGGTTPYPSYAWSINGTAIASECPSSSSTCTFAAQGSNLPGSLPMAVTVTDSAGNTAHGTLTETVNADPSVSIAASQAPTDAGNSVTFTATALAGTVPYTYAWTVDGGAQASTTDILVYSFSAIGTYYVNVTATDSVGNKAPYSLIEIVHADPSASAASTNNPTDVGVATTYSATASGGTSPFNYTWTINSATASYAASFSHTFSSAGSYSVQLTVRDADGNTATASIGQTVNADPTVSLSSSQNPTDVGNTITFTSSVSGGTGTYTYVWQVDGSTVGGATASTYSQAFSSSGTHTIQVTITDGVGSTALSPTFSETVNAAPGVTITSSENPADAGQTATFSALTTYGTSPYTFAWTVGGASQSSTSGTMSYTFGSSGSFPIAVTATDHVGQTASYTLTETINADPTAGISPSHDPTDAGVSVTFTATVSHGTTPYNYTWTLNSATVGYGSTFVYTFGTAGTDSIGLAVRDQAGVTVDASLTETVNADPTVTLSTQYNPVDTRVTDTFSASASGGTGTYSYAWTLNGSAYGGTASTNSYMSTATGTYTMGVTVTDAIGESYAVSVLVTVQRAPSVTATGPTATDVGIATAWSGSAQYGVSPYTYSWSVNGGSVGTTASLSYTFAATGSYTLNLTVTDGQGAKAYWQATITVNSQPTVSVSASSTTVDVGYGITFTPTVTGGTVPIAYEWLVDGTATSSGTILSWTPTTAGSHTVEVQITDAAGAHATSSVVDVTVNALPSLTLSAHYPQVDPGVSDALTAIVTGGTAPITYAWTLAPSAGASLSGSGSSIAFDAVSPGRYWVNVTATDVDGNTAKASSEITVAAPPTVTATGPTATDVGIATAWSGSAQYGVSPYNYTWSVDGVAKGYSTGFSYTFPSTGSFTVNVTVRDSQGVKAYSQLTVTVNALPSASISSTAMAVDVGTTVTLTATVTGGTAPISYQWLVNGAADGTGSVLSYTPTVASPADHFEVETTDAPGNHAYAFANVTVNALPSLSASAQYATVDTGVTDSLTATVSGGTSPFNYTWKIGTTIQGYGSPLSWSSSTPGTYAINVTVRDADGNTANSAVTVTVASPPSVSEAMNQTTVSVGIPVKFTATTSGGVSPWTWAWTKNGASVSTSNPYDVTFTTAGHYWINVTATDSFGRTATASLDVNVTNAPSASISKSASATDVGHSISFSASVTGGTAPYNYTWSVGATISGYGSVFDHTFPAVGVFEISVKVRDANSLTSTAYTNVTVNPALSATMTENYTVTDPQIEDTFVLRSANGTVPYSLAWSVNGTAQSDTQASLTYLLGGPGTYTVSGTVTDAVGETERITVSVVVRPNVGASISPEYANADVGINDALRPVISGGVGPYTYSWLVSGNVYSTEYVTVSFAAPGSATVQLTVSDSFGRDTTVTTTIRVYADPVATVTLGNPPAVVSIAADYSVTISGGYGPFAYIWTFPGGVHETTSSASFTWEGAGSEGYQLYFSDSGGYNETLSLTQSVHLFVAATGNDTRGPATLYVQFGASVLGGSSYVFAWNFGNGQQSSSSDPSEAFAAGNWTVSLVVTASNGAKGWANLTVVSLPPPAVVSWSPSTNVTVLTTISLKATPTWSSAPPYSATWTLPNGTVLHGLTVSMKFPTYSSTQRVLLNFTYNGTTRFFTADISMVPATPTAIATGAVSPIVPGTLLSVSGSASSSPDSTIAYYNWSLSGAKYHGVTQSFYFNATGNYTLALTVEDGLGASATATYSIRVESPGTNASIVISIASTTSGSVTTYTTSVQAPGGISATDSFLGSQLLSPVLINESSNEQFANYSLALNQRDYSTGSYALSWVVWEANGLSNSKVATFTVSSFSPAPPGFDIVGFFGGPVDFIIILATIIGTVGTVYGVTRKPTVDVDVGGVTLTGRQGSQLKVSSVTRKKRRL